MTTQHDTDAAIAELDAQITQACLVRDMAGAGRALAARRELEAANTAAKARHLTDKIGRGTAVALVAVAVLAFAGVAHAKTATHSLIARADKERSVRRRLQSPDVTRAG